MYTQLANAVNSIDEGVFYGTLVPGAKSLAYANLFHEPETASEKDKAKVRNDLLAVGFPSDLLAKDVSLPVVVRLIMHRALSHH